MGPAEAARAIEPLCMLWCIPGIHAKRLDACIQAADEMTDGAPKIGTERLILRKWRESDREPFARMNCDPAVMEHFPALLSREESDALVDRAEAHLKQHGFGPWAAELRETKEFIGYVSLFIPQFEAAFTPCVEIGWRLAREHWGKGLATEGARALVRHGFEVLKAARSGFVYRSGEFAIRCA